jgi:aminodeoxyfutalosine synthase
MTELLERRQPRRSENGRPQPATWMPEGSGQASFADRALIPIWEKVWAGQRLTYEDGLALYRSPDLLGVGRMAAFVNERKNGDRVCFILNKHINPTNRCVAFCDLCAFGVHPNKAPNAYTLRIEEIVAEVEKLRELGVSEVHMVGGMVKDVALDYFLELLPRMKAAYPELHIKAFTAVEIDTYARWSRLSYEEVLRRLVAAGLDSMPGGGAEIFHPEIRAILCDHKCNADTWLAVHRTAHELGLRSNATMLYGHIEEHGHRVDHMLRLRELQDATGGFMTFIPLAWHPENTRLAQRYGLAGGTTGYDDLKSVAVGRLLLDNFDHVKAYWIMMTPAVAQVALSFGVDDIDGTVREEKIVHEAGAQSPQLLPREEIVRLVRRAGKTPVRRDTLYNVLEVCDPDPTDASRDGPREDRGTDVPLEHGGGAGAGESGWGAALRAAASMSAGAQKGETGREREIAEWVRIARVTPLVELGAEADRVRRRLHPGGVVTYIVDRNINYTNICNVYCKFCAFYRAPGSRRGDAYTLSFEEIGAKIDELKALGGVQILLQGGVNPDLPFAWYLDLLRFIKREHAIHVHGFSPVEIAFMAEIAGLPLRETLIQLREAGLDSIPGGGAEILTDRTRQRVSPLKQDTAGWLEVMETAHGLGMKTTATMMFGMGESWDERIEHLLRIRDLQTRTGGFTAFIAWPFQERHTALEGRFEPITADEYLRVVAVARLLLDDDPSGGTVPNFQTSWVTMGPKVGQIALAFGCNDMGSTMLEENVVSAAGASFRMDEAEIVRLIHDAGFEAARRRQDYTILERMPRKAAHAPWQRVAALA